MWGRALPARELQPLLFFTPTPLTRPFDSPPYRPSCSDDDLQPVGVGVFPLGAMANHDCAPNAVHAVVGRCIHIRCAALACAVPAVLLPAGRLG